MTRALFRTATEYPEFYAIPREDAYKAAGAVDLALLLASFKDPRKCSAPDEELELFAKLIDDAKSIYGDLYEGDEEDEAA